MSTRRILLPAMPILLTVALLGCSKSDNGTTSPTTSGKELDSSTLTNGAGFKHTFSTAGTFPYHCTIHSPMQDTIVVAASGLDSMFVLIANSTASGFQKQGVTGPAALNPVKPGGYVRWLNMSGAPHTVTSR